MKTNIEKIKKLNELINISLRQKHISVLDPKEKGKNDLIKDDENIVYDKADWNITKEQKSYVDELSKNKKISNEEKILLIYEKLCKDYVYDDNLISYIKKVDDDTYSIPDWYGRDVDNEWEKNRENHNRRICFELSRYLAQSLKELFKDNDNYNVCIFWNQNLTHYFVGLTSNDYNLALDLDNFFKIKDLTRLKTNLTIEGIDILSDNSGKFKKALGMFNKNRGKYAIKEMENDVEEKIGNKKEEKSQFEDEDVEFLNETIKILEKEYGVDSQGIYEYMKEIIDIKFNSKNREKLWKRIDGDSRESTRYIRCLVVNIHNKKYLIDVDKKIVRSFDEKEFQQKRTRFIPYKELSRNSFDFYDGR